MAKQKKYGIYSPEIQGVVQNIPGMLLSKAYSPNNRFVRLRDGELRSAKARFREFVETAYTTGAVCTTNGSATIILIASNVYTASTHYPAWGSDDLSGSTGRKIAIGQVDIVNCVASSKRFTVTGDYRDHFKVGRTVRVAGSSDNDGDYTVSAVSYGGPNLTSIDVSEDVVEEVGSSGTISAVYTLKAIDSATGWTTDTNIDGAWGNIHAITAIDTGTKTFTVAGDQTSQYTADDSIAVNGSTDGDNDGTYTVVSATLNGGNTDIVVSEAITNGTPAAKGNITDAGVSFTVGVVETSVPAPDGNPILHYRTIEIDVSGSATEYVFGFTKAHAYLWSQSWSAWILKHTCASDATLWDSTQYFNEIVATNNVDPPLRWGVTTNALMSNDWGGNAANGPMHATDDYISKAKFVTTFKNYLIFGYYTITDSTVYGHGIIWNDLATITTWDSGDAGAWSLEGNGVVNGFGRVGKSLVVAKTKSMLYGWHVESDDIFQFDVANYGIGTDAPHSLVNDADDNLYFLGSDYKFYKFYTSGGFDEISALIAPRVRNINPNYASGIEGAYIELYGTLNWSVPYGSEATANNEQWRCIPKKWSWAIDSMAIIAYGKYSRDAGYTFDTHPYDTFDGIAWDSFDQSEQMAGFEPDLCSDSDGKTWALHSSEQDKGSDYTRYHEFETPLSNDPTFHIDKHLQCVDIIHRRESDGDLEVEVKRNTEANYTSVGTIDLTGATGLHTVDSLALPDVVIQKLSCLSSQIKGSQFNIKIKATNRFRLLGIIFYYTPMGIRKKA